MCRAERHRGSASGSEACGGQGTVTYPFALLWPDRIARGLHVCIQGRDGVRVDCPVQGRARRDGRNRQRPVSVVLDSPWASRARMMVWCLAPIGLAQTPNQPIARERGHGVDHSHGHLTGRTGQIYTPAPGSGHRPGDGVHGNAVPPCNRPRQSPPAACQWPARCTGGAPARHRAVTDRRDRGTDGCGPAGPIIAIRTAWTHLSPMASTGGHPPGPAPLEDCHAACAGSSSPGPAARVQGIGLIPSWRMVR